MPVCLARALAVMLLFAGGGSAAAAPAFLDAAVAQTLSYAIVRNGETIGTHSFAFRHRPGTTEVTVDASIRVRVLSVTAYYFEQHGIEVWEGDRLKALTFSTDDDGQKHKVASEAKAGKLLVTVDGQTMEADEMPPASLWRLPPPHATQLLDPFDGKPARVTAIDAGEDVVPVRGKATRARHWVWDGEMKRDLWYDAADTLVQVRIKGDDGSDIYYVLK